MFSDIQTVRFFLKKNFVGPEVKEALRFRLKFHLETPTLDPLVNQVWSAYNQLYEIIKTPCTVLDAGCMSGFLYHHLKKKLDIDYTGVDVWKEALEVGKEFAPDLKLIQGDLTNGQFGQFDYVVLSNIPWKDKTHLQTALENLAPQAKRQLIVIHPNSRIQLIERITRDSSDN